MHYQSRIVENTLTHTHTLLNQCIHIVEASNDLLWIIENSGVKNPYNTIRQQLDTYGLHAQPEQLIFDDIIEHHLAKSRYTRATPEWSTMIERIKFIHATYETFRFILEDKQGIYDPSYDYFADLVHVDFSSALYRMYDRLVDACAAHVDSSYTPIFEHARDMNINHLHFFMLYDEQTALFADYAKPWLAKIEGTLKQDLHLEMKHSDHN